MHIDCIAHSVAEQDLQRDHATVPGESYCGLGSGDLKKEEFLFQQWFFISAKVLAKDRRSVLRNERWRSLTWRHLNEHFTKERSSDAQNQQMRGEQFEKRLASQEQQTAARIDSAMQRELLKQRGK